MSVDSDMVADLFACFLNAFACFVTSFFFSFFPPILLLSVIEIMEEEM